ncbi:MAG: zinc dependent phospholipase C family protein [Nitrospirae bacterium]|nr:zinc dependent phospholipase C family protein [Nitrospirota bacterium]
MAGAFTHFLICDVAKRSQTLKLDLYRLLNKHSEFLFLGAASPDLPYLSLKTGGVNWADVMHYEKTNSIAASGYEALKSFQPLPSLADEIKFVWLMGYISHLVADATIHPIVQATVGPYEQNKEEHRLCEMTQDSLLFNEYKNNDIYYAEFSSALKFCGSSQYFDELMRFWKDQVSKNYQDKEEEAHPGLWFETYTKAVDTAEGGSDVVALFRHLGVAEGYLYRTKAEIISRYPQFHKKYYQEVRLPDGTTGSFKGEGFEKAVSNVVTVWRLLYSMLGSSITLKETVKNWNLDTGVNMDSPRKEVTYWV